MGRGGVLSKRKHEFDSRRERHYLSMPYIDVYHAYLVYMVLGWCIELDLGSFQFVQITRKGAANTDGPVWVGLPPLDRRQCPSPGVRYAKKRYWREA